MVTQLHLAVAMAVDASLLVLDEPTLGLDLLFRKQFYDTLLNDYFDHRRTILVTTHQVEEIEHVLTDVIFIDRGRIILSCSMDDLAARFAEATVDSRQASEARALNPLTERTVLGRSIMLFDSVTRERQAGLGEVRTPTLADIFVAMMSANTPKGAAA
jgi:ABC-2 type transport system ATP-binding protein